MESNHKLARAIANASWRTFRIMLQYKCNWYGKKLVTVNKNNTTQKCSQCGYVCHGKSHIYLGIEQWICPVCGAIHDRDLNAAENILKSGLDNSLVRVSPKNGTQRNTKLMKLLLHQFHGGRPVFPDVYANQREQKSTRKGA